ncbi:hypothetical protein ACOMHN_035004 [Nucella lapillus]
MESAVTRNMRRLLEQYQNLRGNDGHHHGVICVCDTGKKCSDAGGMWDVVVITTADEAQREAFEQQLKDKEQRGELPLDLPIHIVADPPGPRIGNGGSTLVALEALHSLYGDRTYKLKTLMIHAGGWSQRMPSATILGKVFSAIPHGQPLYQVLDLKLAMYTPFIPRLPPGVLLVCADDFLVYDLGENEDWSIPSKGVTSLAHPSPMAVGRRHGVYVVREADRVDTHQAVVVARCDEVLQKPDDSCMRSRGAVLKSDSGRLQFADGISLEGDVVYTDSCFFFGVDVMKKLLSLKKELGTISCEIDAYGDFLQALGPKSTDHYIYNTSNISKVTGDLTQVRKRVFEVMHTCDIHLLLMHASQFIHLGTTKELIQHFCQDHVFQSHLALKKDVFNRWLPEESKVKKSDRAESGDDHDGSNKQQEAPVSRGVEGCVMHSILTSPSSTASSCVVEYCHFEVPVTVEKDSIVSNCQWLRSVAGDDASTSSLELPAETFLHTVSVLHEGTSCYVTVFFHISDNLKKSLTSSKLTSLPFLTHTVGSALRQWKLPESVVSSHAKNPEDVVSLWTLKLYPGAATMTESLQMALDMVTSVQQECALSRCLSPDQRVFSLADLLVHKDVTTMLNFRRMLNDQIVSGRSVTSPTS